MKIEVTYIPQRAWYDRRDGTIVEVWSLEDEVESINE